MMSEALLYLISSLWLGAVHAATPGHGKTIAAAYIVGARGRPADALILGIFVTLSHTSGIVLVAALASLGLPGLVPQHVETYLSLFTGILVLIIGLWLLLAQGAMLSAANTTPDHVLDPDHRAHRREHGTDSAHDHNLRTHMSMGISTVASTGMIQRITAMAGACATPIRSAS